MEENNTELLFTDENIMKALMKMSPENRRNVLALEYNKLFYIANDSEYAQKCIAFLDENVELSLQAKASIQEFLDVIQEQTTGHVLDEMANTYKELSREEQLEFCKKISDESTLDTTLDLLSNNLQHLLGTLQKAVNV